MMRKALRRNAILWATVLSSTILAVDPAHAQFSNVEMPQQSLAVSLRTLGSRLGITVAFDPDVVRGRMAPAIHGNYSPAEAIAILLRGTGLSVKATDARSYIIAKEKVSASLRPVAQVALKSKAFAPEPLPADDRSEAVGLADIIVTAQKREQNLNQLGMTVTAVSGGDLVQRGITGAADLMKIVPGFTYIEGPTGTPVYTLRGIGYVDETLSASPAVSVYVDEVPLPFSTMARAAALDLERIEVLKGPQGTLFGENSTGGAFNYIAAKPKDELGAGINASYGRFNTTDLQGHLTGPLSDNLKGRIAVRVLSGDDWQKSYTRPETLGRTRQYQGRLLLDWKPTDRLSILFNANGWVDKSDTQAPQLIKILPGVPSAILPGYLNYPVSPDRARAADWDPRYAHRRNDTFYQFSLRGDYDVTDEIIFTTITAFEKLKIDAFYEGDGTSYQGGIDRQVNSSARSVFQEIRLAGNSGALNWVVGGNYSHSRASEAFLQIGADASTAELAPGLRYDFPRTSSRQRVSSRAAFGNIEYNPSSEITLKAGVRYTKTVRNAYVCQADAGNGNYAAFFSILSDLLNGPAPAPVIGIGDCASLDGANNFAPGPFIGRLPENNVSWRLGVDWKPGGGPLLLYANASKGYKAGTIGTTPTAFHSANSPIGQEKLIAYEAGIKTPLFSRTMQLNAAAFYYDYSDKQLLGRVLDPLFGLLFQLINIPKSRLYGVEADIVWKPADGLTFTAATTFLDTKIKEFIGYNSDGSLVDFAGTGLPYSPRWQVNGGVDYKRPVGSSLVGFVGSNLSYQSASSSGFAGDDLIKIKPRALLDARIGVEADDGRWSAQIWGRNITNTFYWTQATQSADAVLRFAGRPATYGVSVSVKY
ncbi:TonB-dependent receptor domain-containing protein [Sphingobium phenoxybenzoativorans]|uniref:TonB-dependent receptor domain-containing protein n=1 Tax=Sphingobium phenoxybenzoativorans TaxID=1592790 RepID=UPI0009F6605E|nr:TonB-dependent receptor [Sphingobium phenoxybenzoativorans]